MKKELVTKCPAKINLTLDVINRRNDGYHNLSMIMQTINLFDTLEFSIYDADTSSVKLLCKDKNVPTDSSNLIIKAANLFFQETGLSADVQIHLEKNIPMGAGLGGGSSDAAGTLSSLNTLFGNPLSKEDLAHMAKSLGADVPFFLTGGCMLAEGIGEKLSPLPPLKKVFIVLAKPEISISTALVYKSLILDDSVSHPDTKAAIDALYNQNVDKLALVAGNVLESVVLKDYPVVLEYKSIMKNCGAEYALMSGSGSTVFGIFKDKTSAEKALQKFLSLTPTAYMV